MELLSIAKAVKDAQPPTQWLLMAILAIVVIIKAYKVGRDADVLAREQAALNLDKLRREDAIKAARAAQKASEAAALIREVLELNEKIAQRDQELAAIQAQIDAKKAEISKAQNWKELTDL